MKILLTGANGYLGKQIIEDLASHGHDLVLLSRRKPIDKWSHFEWVGGDVCDLQTCIDAMSGKHIDAVMHVAARPSPSDVKGTDMFNDIANVPNTMQTNIMGLYNMLQSALRAEIPLFLQTGSNCVMGHERRISAGLPTINYLPLDEEHPGEPEDSYSISKACNEIMLKAYSNAYGMKTYAIRPGWILDRDKRIMIATKRAAKPTEELRTVFNSWVALEDVSIAHVLLIEAASAGKLPNNAFYYANADDSLAPEQTMELLEKFRPDLLSKLKSPLEGYASFFSNRKLKNAIDWAPKYSWREFIPGRSE